MSALLLYCSTAMFFFPPSFPCGYHSIFFPVTTTEAGGGTRNNNRPQQRNVFKDLPPSLPLRAIHFSVCVLFIIINQEPSKHRKYVAYPIHLDGCDGPAETRIASFYTSTSCLNFVWSLEPRMAENEKRRPRAEEERIRHFTVITFYGHKNFLSISRLNSPIHAIQPEEEFLFSWNSIIIAKQDSTHQCVELTWLADKRAVDCV